MAYKTDNIVILGGGSAGWMSAATLIKAYPNKSITVVESSTIPTVGVGESTVSDMSIWLNYLGVKPEDFMKFTDASFKTAIGFTNFYQEESDTFFVPFGDPDYEGSLFGQNDWFFKKALNPDTPNTDFFKYYYPNAHFIEGNKITKSFNKEMPYYRPDRDIVYQIDAGKFGLWLAEQYSIPRGVKRIVGTVATVEGDEYGVKSLLLEDGSRVEGDLFIDCSGFRSLLLGQYMNEPFVSTKDTLPNNKAWASPIQYTDKEKELEVYTNCTGLKNGWVWNTPLYSRIGSGYVYSDEFIDDEGALKEFKAHLDSPNMVFYDPHRSEKMDFRQVYIKNGYYERFWVKNVIGIGLAGGFLEPLESTGLYFIHEFLLYLVDALVRDRMTSWDIASFNTATRKVFENSAQFVAMHFSLSQRDDSLYWKKLTSQSIPKEHLDVALQKYLDRMITKGFNYDALLAGMNFSPVTDQVIKDVNFAYNLRRDVEIGVAIQQREIKIARWKQAINYFPTHYQYLKENIYEVN